MAIQSNITRHVTHLKSSLTESNGEPKLPQANQLLYGELAVNYAASAETISLKNSNNEIVTFRPARVDMELDSGSTNPVANSAITEAINELIDDVWVDQEYFTTNGANTFADPDKRYNVVDTLELENGVTYNVGSGCTIHFWNKGKIIGNAVLAINNTAIDAPMKQIFDDNVELGGLFRNSEIYPEWWGAAGDGVTDDADAINRCIKMACHTPVVLTAENYLVRSTIGFEEDVANEAANRAAGITNWAATANTANQLIIKHNIIGDETLAGPVVRFAVAYGICKIYGCIVVRCASDDAIGFTMFPTPGKSFGGNTGEIYIKAIRKGATANFYYGYSQAVYISTYGIGNSVGAVLMATSCKVTIDHVCGFKHGVYMSRVMDSVIHIGECESVYCLYLGSPKSSWITKDGHFFVTRNKIFVGKPSIQNTGYQVGYITGVTDSSIVKEDGNEEISLNEITIGDNNAKTNSRHPYRHSLLYSAGSGGHTGNKYNFNITYGVESTTSPARKFVKFVYGSNPGASNVGQACGDIINFGVGCYLKDIDIPYGWNVKLNNVLISNDNKTIGTYRWFGGFMLLDTVTVSRITSPFHSSASTINILSVNPQCNGMIVSTDTTPSTCENGKLYVVETPVTSGGTAKYPAYCNYFGSGATLVGYVLDDYKDGGGESYVETTYSDLKTLRDNGELVPGTWYRITDYQCTTTQANTSAATHQFDILVLATDTDKLSEEARAVNHSGDTYFANSNLNAWKVWYCLDNNKVKYSWADTTNGKGVIYRMIDEWGNDCPYDFKNIQFKRKLTDGQYDPTSGTDTWVYTFNAIIAGTQSDNSLGLNLALAGGSGIITICAENVIKPYYDYNNQQSVLGGQGEIVLNNNVFLCNAASLQYIQLLFVYANKFDVNSSGNTFKDVAAENIFGSNCIDNTFGDDCRLNVVGNDVRDCQFNSWCTDNKFGNNINNCVFGNPNGMVNSSDSGFYNNTIGNSCHHLNLIGDIADFVIYNGVHHFNTTAITTNSVIVENGVSYVTLDCPSSDQYEKICRNITIAQGVSGSSSAQKIITHPTVNDTFQTIYRPANSQVISV